MARHGPAPPRPASATKSAPAAPNARPRGLSRPVITGLTVLAAALVAAASVTAAAAAATKTSMISERRISPLLFRPRRQPWPLDRFGTGLRRGPVRWAPTCGRGSHGDVAIWLRRFRIQVALPPCPDVDPEPRTRRPRTVGSFGGRSRRAGRADPPQDEHRPDGVPDLMAFSSSAPTTPRRRTRRLARTRHRRSLASLTAAARPEAKTWNTTSSAGTRIAPT